MQEMLSTEALAYKREPCLSRFFAFLVLFLHWAPRCTFTPRCTWGVTGRRGTPIRSLPSPTQYRPCPARSASALRPRSGSPAPASADSTSQPQASRRAQGKAEGAKGVRRKHWRSRAQRSLGRPPSQLPLGTPAPQVRSPAGSGTSLPAAPLPPCWRIRVTFFRRGPMASSSASSRSAMGLGKAGPRSPVEERKGL